MGTSKRAKARNHSHECAGQLRIEKMHAKAHENSSATAQKRASVQERNRSRMDAGSFKPLFRESTGSDRASEINGNYTP